MAAAPCTAKASCEVIRATALTYTAGRSVLLDQVDLDVDAGEMVAVVGPNGAGKSTLVALLGGDMVPTSGRLSISGVEVPQAAGGDMASLRAVLPQKRVSDIPFTAREVVEMARYPHRRRAGNSGAADKAAVTDAMQRTATTEFADRVFATLSGGEQALVAMARILAQEAPVLILDEPTAALDVAYEERILAELSALARDGTAVLAVLHDLNAAARHADRIVALNRGRVVASGTPSEVLTTGLLGDIYGHPMVVVPHPFRDCPLVLAGP